MSEQRLRLDSILRRVLQETVGEIHLYYQPPANLKMQYPCIRYDLNRMAYGPMSVGSDGTFNLLTDKTLTTEDVPADAKAVGDKFKMVYTKTETDGKLKGKADSFVSQTNDPGAGSALANGKLLVVYV